MTNSEGEVIDFEGEEGEVIDFEGEVKEDDDGFKTPTSPASKIPAPTQCPPAPRKRDQRETSWHTWLHHVHPVTRTRTNINIMPLLPQFTNYQINKIIRNPKPKESSVEATVPKERSVEVISWKPRAFMYHNFLTKAECQYLIDIAKPQMQRSKVYNKTGMSIISSSRTSTGTTLARGRDETISKIEKRIAEFTFIPVEHGEGLHVLRYQVGQKVNPHHDYFTNELTDMYARNGGQRAATVIMYLSDVEQGGETVFPKGEKGEVRVKPKMGDALLFWNMKPDHATLDPSSLHAGCPVVRGTKWLSIKWIHVNEYKLNFNSFI